MTSLIVTGTTALTRGIAGRMEAQGYAWPAEVIGATLSAADLTHVSHEVPFVESCPRQLPRGTLKFCARYEYVAALEAIGVDLVGLSGNHVNDFGRDSARESLAFYADQGIPVYGSGLTPADACAPHRVEHNGNRFAFFAALDWGLDHTWVNQTEPGACNWKESGAEILAEITRLRDEVDVISLELQILETYDPFPLPDQVEMLRAARAAGADLVTAVSSHVPKSFEPYGAGDEGRPGFIAYGLGNLFFDQMFKWDLRTQLYLRHAIYDGQLLSTELLAGVLEDYGQPRWATPEERRLLLERLLSAAPARE